MLAMQMLKVHCALLLFTLFLLPAFAQRSYYIDHYTSQNGLPQNSITSMEFDKTGYLWLSTEGGIVRFDGTTLQIMDILSNPELRMDRGNKILKTLAGDVFVQSSVAGLLSFEGGKMRQLKDDNKWGEISAWIRGGIADTNLYDQIIKENLIGKYIHDPDRLFVSMFPVSDSSFILIGWNDPMLFRHTTLFKTLTVAPHKAIGFFMVNGQLMFLDDQDHFFSLDITTGAMNRCNLTGDPLHNLVVNPYFEYTFFCSAPFRHCYVVSGSSLYRLSGGASPLQIKSELLIADLPDGCIINSITADSSGTTIAIGTNSKGLYIYHENALNTAQFNSAAASAGNVYYVQFPLDSYRVLTSNNRIFDARTGRINQSAIGPYEGFAMMRDSQGYIWYAYQDNIIRYDAISKEKKAIPKKFTTEINVLFEDKDKIWVGSQNGIGFIQHDTMCLLQPLTNDPTYSFCQYDGRLLVGTGNGAYLMNPVTFEREYIDGLDHVYVRALEKIGDLVFIGTYDGGFYLWKDGKLMKAPIDRYGGLKDVHAFFKDQKGYIWMTSNKGLYKTTLSSFQHFLADTTYAVYYYRYGMKDGITLDEFNGGCSPPYARLADGTVTLPTMEGLVHFIPENTTTVLSKAEIMIDAVVADGKDLLATSEIDLDCDYHRLEIFFSTPYWGMDENIWLDYKIDGSQQKWIPIQQNQRNILIEKLPFGNYHISIRKRSGFEANDWVQLDLPIHIAPYFYQTWWFMLLLAFILLTLYWLASRFYARNILKRNIRLEAIINQRTGELTHANENLAISQKSLEQSITVKNKLISILSHDIITPLRFIGLSAKMAVQRKGDDGPMLTKTLGDIQNATVKLHDNASNILEWINLQNQRITVHISHVPLFSVVDELFHRVKELAEQRNIQMVNAVSEDFIVSTDAQLLNIILYNIISNSIKHTRHGVIRVTAIDESPHYRIEITDNGNGIPKQILERINAPSAEQLLRGGFAENDFGGSGLGYLLIRDLLPLISGSFMVQSEEGKGTSVQLTFQSLPASGSFS